MTPFLAADPDIGQVVFVIIALLIGFVQWISSLWKQKREALERSRNPPPRRVVYPTVDGEVALPPPPLPERHEQPRGSTTPPFGGGSTLGDLMDTFRQEFEKHSKPQAPAPAPVHQPKPAPPPIPVVVTHTHSHTHTPSPVLAVPLQSASALAAASAYNLKPFQNDLAPFQSDLAPYESDPDRLSKHKVHPLAGMLRTTEGYRQAFILREVLSPPKALHPSPWSFD